jgi:hypothetical protein
MKTFLLVLLLSLPLAGCAEMARFLDPNAGQPDPVLSAQKEVEARQQDVATLQVNLKSAEAASAPTLPQIQADLQVAQTQLEAAEAKVVRAKVGKGFGYAEVTAKVVQSVVEPFFPLALPALTGLTVILGAARKYFGAQAKPEMK